MSAGPHELLYEALQDRFSDGTRRAVLILGAGLHFQLKAASGDASANPDWARFTNWNGLLASVARDFGLPTVRHDDAKATWETLVARIVAFEKLTSGPPGGAKPQSGKAEEAALRALCRSLEALPADKPALQWLGKGLRDFRDVVSLNIDDAARVSILHAAEAAPEGPGPTDMRNLVPSLTWSGDGRGGRLWQPHGSLKYPQHVVLGSRAYSRLLVRLDQAWVYAKAAEARFSGNPEPGKWTPQAARRWWNERRATSPAEPKLAGGKRARLSWLDLFLGSDLIFMGTSLDRAEIDLWWALHMRQRNLARVRASERPRTFVVEAGRKAQHLASGPAGVTSVYFEEWDEAWEMVLGGSPPTRVAATR